MKTIEVLTHLNTEPIDNKIKEILSRGKAVKFTNKMNGIVKIVTEWNLDEGDLLAASSTGVTRWVCPYSIYYEISEIDNDADKTR